MGFYDLSKDERNAWIRKIENDVRKAVDSGNHTQLIHYGSDPDTYIRKNTCLVLGRLYKTNLSLQQKILAVLKTMLSHEFELVRQTAVYALGEIGKTNADAILDMFESAVHDKHHKVINAVIGAFKQMGQKNPKPVLNFAKKFIHHHNPDVRREMIHGIELRGRTHPEDVLPLLKEMENDDNKRVKAMVIHVLGQISYKKNCLDKVLSHLETWSNKELVRAAFDEILEVHKRYEKFSDHTYDKVERILKGKS